MNTATLGGNRLLAERIRNLRDMRGWSLEDLSRRSGFDPTFLADMETGDQDPTLRTLTAIAGCFSITISELLAGIGRS